MTPPRDGLVLVDKPAGVTSFDMVHAVGRALGTRRIGHTGTLDPFATGLLILLVGRGTRLIAYVADEPKVYRATIRFGAETDTDDLTGTVTRQAAVPAWSALAPAITLLTGDIEQVPPDYSAKKVAGRRAYDLARAGTALELAPVRVHVNQWELLGSTDHEVDVRISCGRGTYIRSLARDLGRLTNSAAHLSALRRERAGRFDVADADAMASIRDSTLRVHPLLDAVAHLPRLSLTAEEQARVRHGRAIERHSDSQTTALVDAQGALVALASSSTAGLQPSVVLDAA